MSTPLQRRILERAYDLGANRREVACAIEALRGDRTDLILELTVRRLSVRTTARSGIRNGKQHEGK
jgi:hypothetical protein